MKNIYKKCQPINVNSTNQTDVFSLWPKLQMFFKIMVKMPLIVAE